MPKPPRTHPFHRAIRAQIARAGHPIRSAPVLDEDADADDVLALPVLAPVRRLSAEECKAYEAELLKRRK